MYIEALILGIIVGLVRRGKISRLAYAQFNFKPLIYISALLYLSIIIMNLGLFDYNSKLYTGFLISSYILIGIFLLTNINKKFIFIPLIGLCTNLITFVANSFKFPLSSEAVAKIYGSEMLELLHTGKMIFFMPAENSNLRYLGNIFSVGNFFILSIGDILVALGVILIVQNIMSDKYIKNRNKITFSRNIFR